MLMPTNLEYRERESRRQAGEAQREKERQRAKNKGDIFLLEEQHENLVAVVRKLEMLAAAK